MRIIACCGPFDTKHWTYESKTIKNVLDFSAMAVRCSKQTSPHHHRSTSTSHQPLHPTQQQRKFTPLDTQKQIQTQLIYQPILTTIMKFHKEAVLALMLSAQQASAFTRFFAGRV